MRRTVEGILVVHDHGHPHILMLQIANAFFKLWVPSASLSRTFEVQSMSPHSCVGRSIIATPTSSDSNCQSSELHNITHSLFYSHIFIVPEYYILQRFMSNNRQQALGKFPNFDFFFPSVLPSQTNNALRSPGDYLKPGEDEIDGLKRRLDERLAPPSLNQFDQVTHGINNDWEIGDCLAQWWRPNFETFMVSNVIRIPFFDTEARLWVLFTRVV